MAKKKESSAALLARVTREKAKPRIAKSARRKWRKQMPSVVIESVADILERELQTVIEEWLIRVEKEPDLMHVTLNHDERTGHLPQLLHDVIARLRVDAAS